MGIGPWLHLQPWEGVGSTREWDVLEGRAKKCWEAERKVCNLQSTSTSKAYAAGRVWVETRPRQSVCDTAGRALEGDARLSGHRSTGQCDPTPMCHLQGAIHVGLLTVPSHNAWPTLGSTGTEAKQMDSGLESNPWDWQGQSC